MKNLMKITIVIILVGIVIGIAKIRMSNAKKEAENPKSIIEVAENIPNSTPTPSPTPTPYVDENPVKLGFYLSTGNVRKLITTYSGSWVYHKDIVVPNVIYSTKDSVEGIRIGECFQKYMDEYESGEIYRVGFHIHFETEDQIIDKTIISPKDVEEFYDILEVYLYDGYHRKAGEWYSHTTEEEFNENTIYTAIKLTAGKDIAKITSPITLNAFSYDGPDDFDDDGNYRGNSICSLVVEKK